MKRVKTQFEFDGNTVTAVGTVWDTLFVENIHIVVEDESYNRVPIKESNVEMLNEIAEEMLIDKYTIKDIDSEPETEDELSIYDFAEMDDDFNGGSF